MVRRNYDALVSGDGACAGLRREEHPQGHHVGHRSLHAAALPREGRSVPGEGRRARPRRRAEAGGAEGAEPGGVRALPPGRRAPADGAWRRGRQGHARRASPAHGPISDQDIIDAITAVMRQEAFNHKNLQADRRPARQRHVGDGDGGAHRLQHRLRLDAVEQPASVSLDELALPGRHHRRLAPRRELHRRSRPPVGGPRAAGRRAAAARDGRHHAARVLRVRPLQRRRHDRPGNPRAAEGVGRRRRRRHGRHRLPEHLEGHPPESAERQGA